MLPLSSFMRMPYHKFCQTEFLYEFILFNRSQILDTLYFVISHQYLGHKVHDLISAESFRLEFFILGIIFA